jgi:predicted Zn-dependent protease
LAQEADSTILKAMTDELKRNMTELRYEGFEKPFYISYSVTDVTEHNVAAAMGGLLRSNKGRSRGKDIRVLVGDYEFNDESLDNNNTSPAEPSEIQLPLDNDYYGIRRALWVTTDYIYKSAARQYKKNLETLKEKNKTIAEMPHRRFAAQPKFTISEKLQPSSMDITRWEKDLTDLTAVFTQYPGIEYSGAYVSYVEGYSYFVNSEGSLAQVPVQEANLQIYGQRKTEEGETLYDMITFRATRPEQLPSLATLEENVRSLCKRLSATPVRKLDEEYTGPVLVRGEKVAELLSRTFFSSRESLMYPEMLPDPRGYRQNDPSSAIDSKIGKLVVNENMTVTARTQLTSYNGVELPGAYLLDREGVVPVKDLVLIENGVLKNLLNDRSLIKADEKATGHADGPGVVEIDMKGGVAFDKLKEQLIAEARKEQLEYALIIEDQHDDDVPGVKCTKVFIADGKEEIVRGGLLMALPMKDLKSALLGWSKDKHVYNLNAGRNAGVASYIVNDAILLKDVEVGRDERGFYKEERYISSPITQK